MIPLMPTINSAIGHTGLASVPVESSSRMSPSSPNAVTTIDPSNAPLLLQRLYRNAATNTVGNAISADAASS